MANTANVTIGGYPFVCVRLDSADFADVAAIYVILCVGENGNWTVLDVGQTSELGTRIDSHDRRSCWERNCRSKNIWVCAYRVSLEDDRLRIERALRQQYNPPCGER